MCKLLPFVLSYYYLHVFSVVYQRLGSGSSKVNDVDSDIIRRKEFVWDDVEDLPSSSNGTISGATITCRNSVQGKALLADDRGMLVEY